LIDRSIPKPQEPHLVIEPPRWSAPLNLGEIWQYRRLFAFLVWRDITLRYRQTVLGVAWAILQPLIPVLILSIVFGVLANLPSEGVPYPIFIMSGLLPWILFSTCLVQITNSITNSQGLITKVYCSRFIIPLSALAVGTMDFLVGLVFLLILMFGFYHVKPTLLLLLVPVYTLLVLIAAFAFGLWSSAISVKYRDVRNLVPFLLQFWMYMSPVIYSAELIPPKWIWLYNLNPMNPIIYGVRLSLIGSPIEMGVTSWISISSIFVILIGGLYYFRHVENEFADVI